MLKKSYNLLDFLMRHSFHYWIWTFCALFLIFDRILHMPLELLSHFNFIPEFILNLSKMVNTKPEEVADIVPNVNVVVENKEILSALNKINQSLLGLTEGITNLNIKLSENNELLQSNINKLLEISRLSYNNNQLFNETLVSTLQEVNSSIKIETEAQIKIAKHLTSILNESKNSLVAIDTNISNINAPIDNMQESLTNILNIQKELISMHQNTQDMNLQGFNSIFQHQDTYFAYVDEQINSIFSKLQEVRNHNLTLHQQLTKTIDIKLVEQQNEIIHQIIDEMNRVKTTKTEVNTVKSWSGFFDKTK